MATGVWGNVYVVGQTCSDGWVSDGWDTSYRGGYSDAFIVAFGTNGTHRWSTYLGGVGNDGARCVSTDTWGNVYAVGRTNSDGWLSGGWDTSRGRQSTDGFVVKIKDDPDGDLNGDGCIGSFDLDLVRVWWGQTVPAGSLIQGDPSGDGYVGSADLDIIRSHWGFTVPSAVATTDSEDPADISARTVVGPRRSPACDAAFSAWGNSNSDRRLSDTDLISLAEAAWLWKREGERRREA